jgi:hypothetical protein
MLATLLKAIHRHPQPDQNVLFLFLFCDKLKDMSRENKNEVASPICAYLEAA